MRKIVKRAKFLAPMILVAFLLASFSGCAGTPWKKATVVTYEIAGIGIAHVKETAEHLRSVGAIDDAQLAKIRTLYNEARDAYITAGNTLKAAIETEDALKRDALLEKYGKLLEQFRALAYEIADLLNKLKT